MAFVLIRNGQSKVGQIIDVSRGGLSFKYLSDESLHGDQWELDILLSEHGFLWRRIPYRTVLDSEILPEIPFSSIRMRRRAIAFEDVTGEDATRLGFLLSAAVTP